LTGGSFYLDESPGGLLLAGVILLLFAVAMLALAAYKTYRFCIKYTLRDYFRRRRMSKYLASAQHDSDEQGLSRAVPGN